MCLCTIPCLAGYTYYSGGPDLFVSLGAGNELVPGTTVDLPLVLQNKGTITMESYNVYTLQPEYLPTTAKFATVQLVPGDAPVRVKSNPQIVGDIASGMVVPAEFIVEVPQDATAGRYTMQAIVTYRYVPRVEQEALGTVQYTFKDANISLPVPVVIRPVVILSVEDVFSTFLHAGGEGYVTFTIRNTGQDTGNRTSVYLSPEGASPVVPFTNGVFIGDFPPGATARPRFKVAISPNADPTRPCPVTLYAVYRDFEGNTITSPQVSAGVMLGEKVQFERTSPPPVLHPGKTETFNVTYRNIGTSMVFNARARISVIDPFSSDDDTAYLGTLGPGDSATAVFSIRTDGGATPKTYSVDSEVEYIDAYRTAFSSDNIPVILDVQPPSNNWLIALVVLFALAIGAGVTWWYRKRAADVK
jgi:hypothetical protein